MTPRKAMAAVFNTATSTSSKVASWLPVNTAIWSLVKALTWAVVSAAISLAVMAANCAVVRADAALLGVVVCEVVEGVDPSISKGGAGARSRWLT